MAATTPPPKAPSSPAASALARSSNRQTGSPNFQRNVNKSNNSSPLKPPRRQVSPTEPEGWRNWPDLSIKIDGVPHGITTADLWTWFSPKGDIAYLELFPASKKSTPMSGKMRFEPPPKEAFWKCGTFNVNHSGHPDGIKLLITLSRETPWGWMMSQVSSGRKYPLRIKLQPHSLEFGSMVGPKTMTVMKSIESSAVTEPLKLEFDVRSKRLSVFFSVVTRKRNFPDSRRLLKFVADASIIKTIYQSAPDGDQCALVTSLPYPPQYYWKREDILATISAERSIWVVGDAWHRITDITEEVDAHNRYPVAVHSNINDAGHIDIGRWTTFRLVLDDSSESSRAANRQLQMALEDCNVTIDTSEGFHVTAGGNQTMWDFVDHPPVKSGGGALELLSLAPVVNLPFEVRYQLEVCVSRGILSEHTISADFLHRLAALDPIKARLRLEYLVDKEETVWDPMSLFTNPEAEAYYPHVRIPHYCVLSRKATITPTTIRYSTPAVEASNRVMRKYSHVQDRFLRIQFIDESESGRIGSSTRPGDDEIWKRVLRTLYRGIRIGDRLYEFLAFGSSQLRQAGAYFFCPTDHISCDTIRNWMGQFSHIKIIAKYSARLGQCLSTTREIRGIYVPTIRTIPDIEKNGYCFTDGTGMISEFLARIIIEEMALDIFDEPTAFQFRMGGCKGVLAVWPQAKGMEVCVRASQEKFKADFNGLEIIRCSKFATATLNRQTITILECLGVPVRAFVNLLDHQLRCYESALANNSVAIDLLTRFVDDNQTTLIIAEFLRAGFKSNDGLQEPFVANVLNLWRAWSLKILKEKARIQVEKSAFVLGIVDETRTLRGHSVATEGSKEKDVNKLPQIFLQISDRKQYGKTTVIRGICIVGRNPSLHPGDIRVVQAVDNPKLHHLKDVVVFSATGDRPVPNMLSGGDLDGDDFFVIWEPSLRPSEWNHPPMNYNAPEPVQLERDVNVDDLRNFFVNYMKNDVLGLIATAHLGNADDHGPKSPECLRLAELHSKAVDYPKTGEPAEWSAALQPRSWPHFMEKRKKYYSKKALSVIYNKIGKQPIQFQPDWEHAFDQRILTRYPLSDETLASARQVKSQYDTAVRRVLAQQDLSTEFELWTSFAMTRGSTVSSDYKRQEELNHAYDALKHRFRELCYEAAGGTSAEKLDPFVAAMYKVTEEEIKIVLREQNQNDETEDTPLETRSMPLISFPWIFHWVMIRLALGDDYNPKKSRMAAGRRQEESKASQEPAKAEPADSGDAPVKQVDEVSTKLPDGTLLHRGQPLNLFHVDEYDAYGLNSAAGDDDEISNQAEAAEGVEMAGEREDENASDDGVDGGHVMDRLAKLVDFGDD